MKRTAPAILLFACCALMPAWAARAAVSGLTVANASEGDYNLTSLSVTRNGTNFTYTPGQLTGADLTDVDAFQTPILVPNNASLPAAGTRAALIEDNRLDTGIINITTTNGTPDRSMELTFSHPVINSDGPDVILLNIGADDGLRWWINNDRSGQGQNLLTTDASADLIAGMPYTQYSFLNAATNSGDILSLADLESDNSNFSYGGSTTGSINAFELDLSSVGVPLGGSIGSIRLQSLTGITGSGGRLDPVMVVGLPAVPEPSTLGLVMVIAGWGASQRRRAKRPFGPRKAAARHASNLHIMS